MLRSGALAAALLVSGCSAGPAGSTDLRWPGEAGPFGATVPTEGRPFVVGGIALCTAGKSLTLDAEARFTEGTLTLPLRTRPIGVDRIGAQPGTFAELGLGTLGRTVTAPCGGSALEELLLEATWTGPGPAYGKNLRLTYTDTAGARGELVIPFTLGLCPVLAASGCPSPPPT